MTRTKTQHRRSIGGRDRTALTLLFAAAASTAHAQPAPAPEQKPAPEQPPPEQKPPEPPPPEAKPPEQPSSEQKPPEPPPPESKAPAPPSDAPVPVENPPDGGTAEGEVIVVTGSRIGDPLGKQAPVLTLSREDLERSGLHSIGDVLQQLTVSGGAINGKFNSSGNFGFPPDGGGIGAGATEADLRYLGSKRVLVLVDGVRWVNGSSASGVAAATDLNTIPLSVIERVEVLEDGASPIYGSDAIAGVINIITRKQLDGVYATAYTGGYHKGDGFVHKYDVSWGNTTDKMSVIVSASYLDQRSVFSADRELSNSPIPGLDNCQAGCSSATPQGRLAFVDPLTMAERDITLDDFGDPNRGQYHDFTSADRFNFSPYNLVLTPSRRMGVFSTVTYKLGERVNLRAKGSFTNRQSVNQAAPEPLFIGPEAGNGNRLDHIGVDVTNPYNPFGFTFDPATNPFVITRRPLEAGPRRFEQNVDTFYVAGGLEGNAGKEKRWTWDATLAYGINRADQRRNNSFNSARLQTALGPAFLGTDGKYHCGTTANPGDPDCVPFDIFGGQGPDGKGTITREMLDYVTFTEHDVSEQKLFDAVANVSGKLAKLPGGWLAVAAGVEHRRLSGFFEPDAVVAAGDGADVPAKGFDGSYSVSEVYGEVRVPVVQNKPGAELVDANAAARVSDYSFLSPQVTAKLGARWKPTTDLVLRGSYGQGFRAPSIGELHGTKSRYDATLTDPCSDYGQMEKGTPQSVKDRCMQLGVPASYSQLNPQISVTTGGNRDLVPETSKSLNLSLAYSPRALQDRKWSSSVDLELAYYDVKLDDAIAARNAQAQINSCVLNGDDTLCQGISRTPQGTINGFTNTLINIGGIEVSGLDLGLSYRLPRKSFGKLRFASQTSYLLKFWEKTQAGDGFETVKNEGRLVGTPEHAFPRLKSSLAIGWLYNRFDLTLTTRFISSVTEACPKSVAANEGTCSKIVQDDLAASTNHLGATVYNDVQVVWSPEFAPKLSVTAGVNNLLNREPPVCYSCSLNGFNGATYDVPGIFGYLSAAYRMP
ncbi:MAG TPA: TonB-dependent receptor [Kofleriaceae bacterium]|nr:TonB-dependent receptor [Kofleriaceae bacterium]